MEVKLIMVGGKNSGQEVPVTGPRFFVGRAEDCQLRPRSDLISRHHCVILVEETFVAVRDFGSKNGTYVNGQRITSEAELKTGDILKVGPIEFEVRIGAPSPARHQETVSKPATVVSKPAEAPAKPAEVPAKPAEAPAKPAELAGKKKPKVRSVQEAAARTVESAATAKEDDEEDVSSWLDDDDESGSMTETAAMEPTRMAKAPPPPAEDQPAPEPAKEEPVAEAAEEEDEEEAEAKPKSQAFEVPGARRGPSAGTSKDAAANMLKNFFHRR